MSGLFIDNIRKIILEHVQNEKFGVPELAAEIGLSSSQLLRNIKSTTGKTPGEFIKEIRLNEALKLLKENDYTASEVSFRVGFNSPSYFNKCFHDHFGYTPGDVKQMNIPEVTKKTSAAELNMDSGKIQNKTKSKKKTILITFITTLLLIIASYIIYNYFTDLNIKKTSEINIPEKSIAVLPFKNLSDNKNNQYFADGVMNDILNHLSAIKGFKVISITTMEQYRSTKKTAPKIGKELKVSYILESSIQKYKDSIKIVSQLIDAKNDKHLWSKKFERELENIFALESEIAREIAAELKITLTPAEIKKIEKVPTKNLEAYNYYLLGRHFWNKRTLENYNKSIYYYEKAIQKDSTYGLAYAGMADTYHLISIQGSSENRNKLRDKTVELTQKALEFDENLAMVHTVLGSIYTYNDHEWEKAEKEFLKAIELDPNYPTAHQYYAELLRILCRHQEARKHINTALELDPLSFVIKYQSAKSYFNQGNFEEALKGSQQCHDLIKDHPWLAGLDFNIYYFAGMELEALEKFKKYNLQIKSFNSSEEIDSVYKASGFDGLFRSWIEHAPGDIYLHAQIYSCIGEYDKALDLLEQLCEEKKISTSVGYIIDFKPLHSHPRFIAILEKINLTGKYPGY